MEQYEKSGPLIDAPKEDIVVTLRRELSQMAHLIQQQDRRIQQVQKEVERLKSKLDQHANYLNNTKY